MTLNNESADTSTSNHLSDALMATVMRHSPIPCVDIVLINEAGTHTLLCKRTNEPAKDVYFTIGGRLWKNETFVACAIRKAHQELSITLTPEKLIGPFVTEDIHPNSAFPDVSYHAVPVFFFYTLSDAETQRIILDTQHAEYAWFARDDTTLHPHIRARLAYRPHN